MSLDVYNMPRQQPTSKVGQIMNPLAQQAISDMSILVETLPSALRIKRLQVRICRVHKYGPVRQDGGAYEGVLGLSLAVSPDIFL
jgi:hypothetical protein